MAGKGFRIIKFKKDKPIFQIKDISKSFDGRPILKKINMELYPGEIVGLLGPNGSGKSTLYSTIIGEHQADNGKIIINNVDIPVIADIHFHYKRAIEAAENGAKCLRINPGNIGDKQKIHDVLEAAKNNDCSIRIGVNAGSLEKDILEKFKEQSI